MKSSVSSTLLVSTVLVMMFFASVILMTSETTDLEEVISASQPGGRGDYTPTNEWIEVTHTMSLKSPISISISSAFDVREVTITNTTFTADDLREMSGGNATSPVISNSLFTEINGYVRNTFQKFSDGIKPVADYVHGKGLKFGIYSCAGSHIVPVNGA